MDASDGGAFNERILEGLRPNFFELLSQEAMHHALRPACQYFLKVRTTRVRQLPSLIVLWTPYQFLFLLVHPDLSAEQTRLAGPSVEVCG